MCSYTSFKELRYMNQYDIHKALINEYIFRKPDAINLLKRDTSKDRTDYDVLKANHRFLWDDKEPKTWEEQFAKKYYNKLFKEYCIGDLSRFKENKIALRWRTEQEVVSGRGQFSCGNKRCSEKENLRTWEVNFAYKEDGEKKNALVKIRLCRLCSEMLNYSTKKREIKRLKYKSCKKRKDKKRNSSDMGKQSEAMSSSQESVDENESENDEINSADEESPWVNLKPPETKSRGEEMEEYLQALLF